MVKSIPAYCFALAVTPLICIAAEPWDFLEFNLAIPRTIAVKGITISKDGKVVAFNVLDGYIPSTAELGYKRRVGARVRFAFHLCGSQAADVGHVWLRDDKNELFLDEEYASKMSIPLASDDAIRRAALYACGDKSQKVGDVTPAPPKDAMILVCRDESSGKEHSGEEQTFTVSEKMGTVNGGKADFTPAKITYPMGGGAGNRFILEINRHSGGYSITQEKDNFRLYSGKCVKQDKQQF